MKRSEANKALHALDALCEKHHCYLPPSAISRRPSGKPRDTNLTRLGTAACSQGLKWREHNA